MRLINPLSCDLQFHIGMAHDLTRAWKPKTSMLAVKWTIMAVFSTTGLIHILCVWRGVSQ